MPRPSFLFFRDFRRFLKVSVLLKVCALYCSVGEHFFRAFFEYLQVCVTCDNFYRIMRVKSVPRHLPRRDGTGGTWKAKNAAAMSTECFSAKKIEGSRSVNVKTVNFTNYHEMVKEMDLAVRKQVFLKNI